MAALASGCAAGRAFRRGQEAAHNADWDAAVTYYTKAVQANPDNPEYKINLQRAQEEAARVHIERGRELEKRDQLDGALAEYRRAMELDAKNRLVAARVADLEKTIREKLEATRPLPRIEQLRQQARTMQGPPLLNPASRDPLRINFNNASLRDILNFIGTNAGINVTYDQQFVDKLGKPWVGEGRVWVALADGRPVGMSWLGYYPTTGSVFTEMTGVARAARGRGVARALKLRTIAQALEAGVGLILTEKGREIACNIQKRHETLSRFFSVFDLDADTQKADIEGIEHHLSPATVKAPCVGAWRPTMQRAIAT